jgi:hypothetical protein
MIDTKGLVDDLSTYGEIILIGYNSSTGFDYIVVMNNVGPQYTIQDLNTITSSYLEIEFPVIAAESLVNGTYKLDRTKQ